MTPGDWTDDLPEEWPDEGLDGLADDAAGSVPDHGGGDDPLAGLLPEDDRDRTDDAPGGLDEWDLDDLADDGDDGTDHHDSFDLLDDDHDDNDDDAAALLPDPDEADTRFGFDDLADDPLDLPTGEPATEGLLDTFGPRTTADAWVDALGGGAVDPSGAAPTTWSHLDLDELDDLTTGPTSTDWLADSDAEPEGWLGTDLLSDEGDDDGDVVAAATRAPGVDAVTQLWDRLAPDEAMPTDAGGAPDHTAALDALSTRAASPALSDVVDAARRLLRP